MVSARSAGPPLRSGRWSPAGGKRVELPAEPVAAAVRVLFDQAGRDERLEHA
jgi:hypothetical protein